MDASLPGSSLMTHEQTNDFHGVTHRIAYRRDYGSGADFTFIVDDGHYIIAFFENWIRYIVNEKVPTQRGQDGENVEEYPTIDRWTSYSRVNYFNNYVTDGMYIQKFERNYELSGGIQYNFLRAFPLSITSMPVSYEASQLLKCTVSFTYSRYYTSPIDPEVAEAPAGPAPGVTPSRPEELRDDWAIWYMTWGRSRRDVLTPAQKAFGDRVEARISSDPTYLSGLRDRGKSGSYTVPGPTERPGMGPGPLMPAGRPLGDLSFISAPGYTGSVITGRR
jgi:hypothetical protein